jgi:hypothetical protein
MQFPFKIHIVSTSFLFYSLCLEGTSCTYAIWPRRRRSTKELKCHHHDVSHSQYYIRENMCIFYMFSLQFFLYEFFRCALGNRHHISHHQEFRFRRRKKLKKKKKAKSRMDYLLQPNCSVLVRLTGNIYNIGK